MPSQKRIGTWEQLREAGCSKHTAHRRRQLAAERTHAMLGAWLLAQAAEAPVWPARPRAAIRYPRASCRVVAPFCALVLLARERGHRSLVITLAQLAQLAGCSKRSAHTAITEAAALGYVTVRPWFDALQTVDGAAGRTTASGRPVRHWQRANAYLPGPLMVAELARAARSRGANARLLERETERLQAADAVRDRNNCDPTDPPPSGEELQSTRETDRLRHRGVEHKPPTAARRREAKAAGVDALCARTLARAAAQEHRRNVYRPAAPALRKSSPGSATVAQLLDRARHAAPTAPGEAEATPTRSEAPAPPDRAERKPWSAPPPVEFFDLFLQFSDDSDEPPVGE